MNHDLFAGAHLPVPQLTDDEAAELGSTLLHRAVRAEPLGSQQDANFLLTCDDDGDDDDSVVAGVLKITNAGSSQAEVDCQDAAAAHLAAALPDLRFPTVIDGTRTRVASGSAVRVLSFLPGGTLNGSGYLHPTVVGELGRVAAQVSEGLRDFAHPGAVRTLQWDLRHADRVLDRLAGAVPDGPVRDLAAQVRDDAWPLVAALASELPVQAVHGDLTDDNVVCRWRGHLRAPDGVIDFGDVCSSWAVAELAVTVSSLLHHDGMTPLRALDAVRAFHQVRLLSAAEADALWPLVALRGAVLVASGHHQLAVDDGANDYAAAGLVREERILDAATALPLQVMRAAVRRSIGLDDGGPATLPPRHGRLVPQLAGGVSRLDLSTTSDDLHSGRWLHPGVEDQLAAQALDAGAAAVVTRFGEPRLTRSAPLSQTAPATVATGVDVWFADPVDVVTPWAGELSSCGETITLTADEHVLVLSGPAVGDVGEASSVVRGAAMCSVPPRSRLRVTVLRGAGVPDLVTPEEFPAWASVVCDPSALLADAQADTADDDAPVKGHLLERRSASLAPVQEHYYRDPPQIERGWREHLVSTTGRSYLDMVNNVAVLGHGDPGLADAVARQLRRLNTNSRFHYAAVVDFSEQLAATLPDPLEAVFLVNSGSEAVDLALRITMAATDRRDVVAVGEAYHGWTYASDAVSTSLADNPGAAGTRPDWVHVVDAPDSYRGRRSGAQAQQYAADAVAAIDALAARGRPPAAFVCESFLGNAGGIALPEGYLAAVHAAVRRHGGLVIADEVQVGYGRLGHWFWGFEQQGVVPDVVTVAKAMGNGHPLGAVVTTRAVAERFGAQGSFFSSPGGSPASSVVGSYVLGAIQQRGLQENARDVGDHLRSRLEALAERHPLVGAVHGSGLYVGVELVRDRQTREPATEETARICDRLLELGVIVQPTGDRRCVLKVKPPMVLEHAGADFFVDALDHVLTTGF